MIFTQDSLYQLKPQEFEALCAKAIKEIIPEITDVELVGNMHGDFGVDIVGKLHGEIVAIEVKHKLRINRQEVQRIFDTLLKSPYKPKHVVLMSSAMLKDIHHSPVTNPQTYITYHFIGANDILEVMNTKEINQTELIHATKRVKEEKRGLIFSSMTMTIALGMMGSMLFDFWHENKESPTLTTKIQSVEKSINNLKDLENQLKDMKEDMLATEKASKTIEQNYRNAQELQKLTDQQLEALKGTLQSQSWKDLLLQNLVGFILGISSSIVATILHSKFKRRQALEQD